MAQSGACAAAREWSVFLVVVALAIVVDLWRGQRPSPPVPPPVVELEQELPELLLDDAERPEEPMEAAD
jgi:hypothetical protein